MYGYIYKTTNLINGKIYISQKKSKKFVKTYFGSGTLIKQAVKKYGKENFTVELIDFGISREELDIKEKEWIDKSNANWRYGNYNIADGGFTSGYDINTLPIERQKEIKEKISKAGKRRKHTEETRRKMSKTRTGKTTSLKGKPSPKRGIKLTESHKKKLSESHRGKTIPEEQRLKMSETHKKNAKGNEKLLSDRFDGYRDNRKRKVIVYSDGLVVMEFQSCKECIKYFSQNGLGRRVVMDNLNHKTAICPKDKPKFMSRELWESRKKYRNHMFLYE